MNIKIVHMKSYVLRFWYLIIVIFIHFAFNEIEMFV